MVDRDNVDAVLQRVALLSFLYYPEIQVDEPDYELASDIGFCMEPLADLDEPIRDQLRNLIGRAIIDPSEYREQIFAVLSELATPDDAGK
jgi:hypothetical protein